MELSFIAVPSQVGGDAAVGGDTGHGLKLEPHSHFDLYS